jgi:hypothetical protein
MGYLDRKANKEWAGLFELIDADLVSEYIRLEKYRRRETAVLKSMQQAILDSCRKDPAIYLNEAVIAKAVDAKDAIVKALPELVFTAGTMSPITTPFQNYANAVKEYDRLIKRCLTGFSSLLMAQKDGMQHLNWKTKNIPGRKLWLNRGLKNISIGGLIRCLKKPGNQECNIWRSGICLFVLD